MDPEADSNPGTHWHVFTSDELPWMQKELSPQLPLLIWHELIVVVTVAVDVLVMLDVDVIVDVLLVVAVAVVLVTVTVVDVMVVVVTAMHLRPSVPVPEGAVLEN